MDHELVSSVADAVKAGKNDHDGVVAQLFAQHSPDEIVAALKHLSQEIQVQLGERLAEWADYKTTHHPREEFLEEQADYLSWKAAAGRYRDGINAALRAAKRLRSELSPKAKSKDHPQKRKLQQRATDEGYVKGARVMFSTDEGGDVGSILEVQGRSIWVVWDKNPNLPVQYASPWTFSVIEPLEVSDGSV
jgi:hypothetical protein